ncbi:MAG: hypothetical protein Q9227_006221 [Pyrenula ochraceoflavens]
MPAVSEDTIATYRKDSRRKGTELTAADREKLLKPYLPALRDSVPPSNSRKTKSKASKAYKPRRKPIRTFLKTSLHILLFHIIQFLFSVYIRFRHAYRAILSRILAVLYYHHRTPELIQKDVRNLSRLPEHLSIILHLHPQEEDGGLTRLMDEAAEVAAWCACAGIPLLSVYEKSGALKPHIPTLHTLTTQKLTTYFGPTSTPPLRITSPRHTAYTPSPSPTLSPVRSPSSSSSPSPTTHSSTPPDEPTPLTMLLLSSPDGRDTLVDLTRTLTEMSQSAKLSPDRDITTDLIDAEIMDTTAVKGVHGALGPDAPSSEPDLVIVFGPYVKLDGYPPWQVRLSEIYCVGGDAGNTGRGGGGGGVVEYQGFLQALWRYSGAQFRFGR